MRLSRRDLLRSTALGTVLLAGCSDGGDGAADTPTVTAMGATDGRTGTATTTVVQTTTGTNTATETETATDAEPTETETETETATEDGTPADGGGTETSIDVANNAYDPLRADVEPGTTVTWTNQDSYAHDVVSARFHDVATEWDYDSDLDMEGATATHTFESEGIYEYYCSIHGQGTMCGAVLVGDVTLDADLPCE